MRNAELRIQAKNQRFIDVSRMEICGYLRSFAVKDSSYR